MSWAFVDHLGRSAMRVWGAQTQVVGGLHTYSITGRGTLPPMVLLHGIGVSGLAWGLVMRLLLPDAGPVTIPDLPGHGFSPVPPRVSIEGVFEALDAGLNLRAKEPVVLVGHSLGALLAIRLAARSPERVLGMVLVTPAGGTVAAGALDQVKARLEVPSNTAARALMDRMLAAPAWYSALAAPYLRETYSRPVLRDLIRSLNAQDMLSPEELRGIRAPIRLLWGTRDQLLPQADLDYLRSNLQPHADVVEVADFGHGPLLDQADLVARHIIEFAMKSRE